MNLSFFIAKRHIARAGGAFRKTISFVSIGGVSIGVAALITVISVENGFHKNFKEKLLANNAEVILRKFHNQPLKEYKELIEKINNETQPFVKIKSISPFIYGKGILRSEENQDGVVLKGIVDEKEIINLNGSLDGIVLGKNLASNLDVFINDPITIFTYSNNIMRTNKIKVSGIFDAGLYEYNSSIAYLSLEKLQNILGLGDEVSGLEIRLNNIYKAPEVAKIINKKIGYPYFATHWIELNSNLFSALKLERITFVTILILIIIVACFGISAILTMLITQKTKEIGILRAIGATPFFIKKIFITEGVLIGIIGTIIGTIIGLCLCIILNKYKISIPQQIYGIGNIPVDMKIKDILIINFGVVFLAFISSVYPATKAAKIIPAEAIRNE